MEEHTAGLIVVGNEILRGDVVDTNTSYLASNLRSIGVKLRKVTVIPDIVEEIAEEIREAAKRYSTVFTSGGVGPTHDDVTYEAVAKAFGLKLELHETLVEIYSHWSSPDTVKYLAVVPKPCELIYVNSSTRKNTYCVIKVRNVFLLPGSPKYFVPAVDSIIPQLKGNVPLHFEHIDVKYDEIAIVEILNTFVKRWENKISVGSYPQSDPQPFTRITLEGHEEDVLVAKKELTQYLSFENGANTKDTLFSTKAYEIIQNCNTEEHVKEALNILKECFDKYSPNEIFLSFNGGKDCTVMLHLAVTLAKLQKIPSLLCFYVTSDPFPEVEEFVTQAVKYYDLELIRMEGPMQTALSKLLEDRKTLKACLMGTRKGDPGSEDLEFFTPTDANWPQLMRVSPILNWSYDQVWRFLLQHKIPYCSLYDKGYTSIGTRATTAPNPLLKDPKKPSSYLPAYALHDVCAERQGRE